MADMNAQTYVPVADGETDVAVTMDGEQMKVQATGRRPMQRVYLWSGNKDATSKKKDKGSGLTNKPYKPEEDGPKIATQGGHLPGPEELESNPSAVQYLEVGLVIGDEPGIYKPTAHSKKKDIKTERQRRGEMPRHESALRAFIPITENIPTQSKYYVGTKLAGGRLNPRGIDGEFIFFYPEFWRGVTQDANKKERREFINNQTKHLAAANKTQAERATASITVEDIEKWTTSNPLAVTPAENLVNMLTLDYTLYQATGDRNILRNMLSHLTNAAPDLRYGPNTAAEGVNSFFDFEEELSLANAKLVVQELKIAVSAMPNLSIDVVRTVHRTMKEEGLGDRLPYEELGFFLGICDENIKSQSIGKDAIKQEVERALQTVHLHGIYNTGRATSKIAPMTKDNYRVVLGCTKDTIDALVKFIRDSSRQVAEQHGGILKQAGIKELMNKIGAAVDVVHLQNLVEQVAGLHAVQHAAANGQAAEQLSQLSEQLGKILTIAE